MINDVEHLLVYFLAIDIYLEKCLFEFFAFFFLNKFPVHIIIYHLYTLQSDHPQRPAIISHRTVDPFHLCDPPTTPFPSGNH